MAESRLVRCRGCGHEWESSAKDPRCSDPDDECGRSRADPVESSPDTDSESQAETESGTDDDADTDSSGSWTPLFNTESERTGAGQDSSSSRPSTTTSSDDTDDDSDDDSESDDAGADVEIPELEPEDVRPFLVTIFGGPPEKGDDPIPGYASMNRGEHWAMRNHELDQLSRAYARVGNKYLPYLLSEYTAEGLALLTTVTIVAPRLQEDRRRREHEKKAAQDTGRDAGNVRSDTSSSTETESNGDGSSVEQQLDELNTDGEGGWTAGASV